MDFGIRVFQAGHLANREANLALARRAEGLGFHSLWVAEHVVIPRSISTPYPGNASGRFPFPADMAFLEAISLLSFIAAATERIRLGTSVLALPMRHPVLTAKMLSTLDVLSNGRLIAGVGTGWMREEFEALNVSFERRGARLDEYVEVILRCWTRDDPSFKGEFFTLSDVGFYPKPVQRPHPPLWVGGWSDQALRRAARFASAWHASGSVDVLATGIDRIRKAAEHYGRKPEEIGLSLLADDELTRWEPARILDELRAYKSIGISHVLLTFAGRTVERAVERVETFMDTVAARL